MSDLISRLRKLGDRAYTSPVAWIDGDVGDLAHEAADALETQQSWEGVVRGFHTAGGDPWQVCIEIPAGADPLEVVPDRGTRVTVIVHP